MAFVELNWLIKLFSSCNWGNSHIYLPLIVCASVLAIFSIFGWRQNDCSFAHLTLILLLHYLVKWWSQTVSIVCVASVLGIHFVVGLRRRLN